MAQVVDFSFDALFVQGLLVSPLHNLQSVYLMTQITHVLNAFQGKLHKRGICSILLWNKYSLAYFLSLVILILFLWNEKVPVSGVGDWLFVCFTSNHQPKPKALKVPNEGNERRSRSQATKQNKSVCVYGGREKINLIRIVYHEVVRCESKRMASVYLS